MAEFMTGMKRTDYCGDLRIGDVGRDRKSTRLNSSHLYI